MLLDEALLLLKLPKRGEASWKFDGVLLEGLDIAGVYNSCPSGIDSACMSCITGGVAQYCCCRFNTLNVTSKIHGRKTFTLAIAPSVAVCSNCASSSAFCVDIISAFVIVSDPSSGCSSISRRSIELSCRSKEAVLSSRLHISCSSVLLVRSS